jgi:copper chaperone NosL
MKKWILALVVIACAVALVVRGGTQLPDSVQPVAWNAEACAHCHMLIGDPAYAAQVISVDGEVLSFDDPGCAAAYIRKHRSRIHRAWFHAGRGDTWIPLADVGFVRVAHSPMGSNVMAVPRTTPGALALEDVR